MTRFLFNFFIVFLVIIFLGILSIFCYAPKRFVIIFVLLFLWFDKFINLVRIHAMNGDGRSTCHSTYYVNT